MKENTPSNDIEAIVTNLKRREIHVTGPYHKGGEPTYWINGHVLSVGEIRSLAHEDRLTTWEIHRYVKQRNRDKKP